MAKYLWVLMLVGCTAETVTQADDGGGAGGSAAGALSSSGGVASSTAGASALGGKTAAGGATVSTGGASAAGGSTAATVPACLATIKDGCLCAGAYKTPDISGWLENCNEALDCLRKNTCGPYDACAIDAGVCVVSTGAQAVQMARETYDCSCGAGECTKLLASSCACATAECQKVTDCYIANSCKPGDACTAANAVCSAATLGVTAVATNAAAEAYSCACGA